MKIYNYLTFLFFLFGVAAQGQDASQDSVFSYISTFPKVWQNVSVLDKWPGLAATLSRIDSESGFSSTDRRIVWVKGDILYGYGDCGLDIFKGQADASVENLYNYDNKGYNCTTRFFIRDDVFYLLGGYGYWRFHSDLMKFDVKTGAWELVKTHNQPEYYFSRQILMTADGIVSLIGGYFNSRYDLSTPEPDGHFLDWATKTWSPISLELEGDYGRIFREKFVPESWFETAHFGLVFSAGVPRENGIFIFDKQTLEVFYYPEGHRDLIPSTFFYVEGDKITYSDQPGNLRTMDVLQLKNDALQVGKVKILRIQQKKGGYVYVFGGLVVIVLGIFFRVFLQKKMATSSVQEENHTSDELDQVIRILEGYQGVVLTSDELSAILNLDTDKRIESSRVERSRLIKKINQKYSELRGKQLIHRMRNAEDKRIIDYRITP